jgi:hypothetical protein
LIVIINFCKLFSALAVAMAALSMLVLAMIRFIRALFAGAPAAAAAGGFAREPVHGIPGGAENNNRDNQFFHIRLLMPLLRASGRAHGGPHSRFGCPGGLFSDAAAADAAGHVFVQHQGTLPHANTYIAGTFGRAAHLKFGTGQDTKGIQPGTGRQVAGQFIHPQLATAGHVKQTTRFWKILPSRHTQPPEARSTRKPHVA